MAILLRRNAQKDQWFSVHGNYIKEGDIVRLTSFTKSLVKSITPTIHVNRGVANDPHEYNASLNCFDYVKQGVK